RGPHAVYLVGDTARQAGILTEEDRDPAAAVAQAFGDAPDPAARLAVARRQFVGRSPVALQRAQGGLQHDGRLALDAVAPRRLGLPVAAHASQIPSTIQRTGEFFAPTSSRAAAPSFVRITRSALPAPRLSIASNGSPSSLPSGVNSWTTSNFQPFMLGCLTVAVA